MPAQIKVLSSQAIKDAFSSTTRQYLVGELKNPQPLKHIPHNAIEIGLTQYKDDDADEPPHRHTQAYEFQYMLSGNTAYLDINTGEELRFGAGDFYMIEPGVTYAQKSSAGTAILFIKIPPGNDKVPCPTTDEIEAWFNKPIGGER